MARVRLPFLLAAPGDVEVAVFLTAFFLGLLPLLCRKTFFYVLQEGIHDCQDREPDRL